MKIDDHKDPGVQKALAEVNRALEYMLGRDRDALIHRIKTGNYSKLYDDICRICYNISA